MKKKKEEMTDKNVDKGFAWVILAALFTTYMLSMGIVKSFGILYKELLDMYGYGAGYTAFIGSTASFIQSVLAPLWNSLCVRLSFRKILFTGGLFVSLGFFFSSFVFRLEVMFLTYSVISGLGFGLIFSPSGTLINFYFERRRALANGILVSASGFGAFAYPYIYRILFDFYGFQGGMLIISAVLLNCCVAAFVCRQPKRLLLAKKTKDEASCLSFLRAVFTFKWNLFRNRSFFVINLAFAVTLLGYGANYYILPAHISELGYSRYDAALCMTVMGITESVARIFMGWLTDLRFLSPKTIYSTCMVVGGIASICVPLATSYSLVCAYAMVVGIFPATFYTLIPIILVDILGLDLLPAAYGLVTMSMALMFVVGQPALGYLNDYTGNWSASFVAAGSVLIFAGAIALLEERCSHKLRNNARESSRDDSCAKDGIGEEEKISMIQTSYVQEEEGKTK